MTVGTAKSEKEGTQVHVLSVEIRDFVLPYFDGDVDYRVVEKRVHRVHLIVVPDGFMQLILRLSSCGVLRVTRLVRMSAPSPNHLSSKRYCKSSMQWFAFGLDVAGMAWFLTVRIRVVCSLAEDGVLTLVIYRSISHPFRSPASWKDWLNRVLKVDAVNFSGQSWLRASFRSVVMKKEINFVTDVVEAIAGCVEHVFGLSPVSRREGVEGSFPNSQLKSY